MKTNQSTKQKGVLAFSQISILIISIFAFSYLISEVKLVSATDSECNHDGDCDLNDGEDVTGCRDDCFHTVSQGGDCDNDLYCEEGLSCFAIEIKDNPTCNKLSNYQQKFSSTGGALPKLGPAAFDFVLSLLPESKGGAEGGTQETAAETEETSTTPETPASKGEEKRFGLVSMLMNTIGLGNLSSTNIVNKLTVGGLLDGAGYAIATYYLAKNVLPMLGAGPELTEVLSWGLAAGIGAYYLIPLLSTSAMTAVETLGISLGIALFVTFIVSLISKETRYELYSLQCDPWQAEVGGSNCARCNDGEIPCTEYRCKSLGQACEIVNKGTKEELCAWTSKSDISDPVLTAWNETLTEGYVYTPDKATSPPDKGVKIIEAANPGSCISVSKPLTFGVISNEPASCKIDAIRQTSFKDMRFYMGSSPTLKYNHSQTINLIDLDWIKSKDASLYQNENVNLYVRCQDANGNANVATFVFNFCVQPGPDTTAPQIKGTSILNGMPVAFGQTDVSLDVYLSEPSECKWSIADRVYDDMENTMTCDPVPTEFKIGMTHTCKTTLTGLKDRQENVFYFRCKDHPELPEAERNVNQQSYKFTLIGTQELIINKILPESGSTIRDARNTIPVNLEVETGAGFNKGVATCYYSSINEESRFVKFFKTGSYTHTQELALTEGDYTYYIKCLDLGGNSARGEVSFRVEADNVAPKVVRVYKDNTELKIITNENAQCVYDLKDCTYLFPEDSETKFSTFDNMIHSIPWDPDLGVYYIKCKDAFGNQPAPNSCTIILRPTRFL